MKVRFRARAAEDVRRAERSLRVDAGDLAAERFIEAIGRAVRLIRRSPLSGSPRFGRALNMPELRCVVLRRVPWSLFYAVTPSRIEVLRVLHQRSDIPHHLQ